MDHSGPIFILPGAKGATNLTVFRDVFGDNLKSIRYPDWRRTAANDFSAETLISDLTNQIETMAPNLPIYIIGNSIGGHFGYAIAVRLEASGRQIAGFCAIDTFMVKSTKPSAGWIGRVLTRSLQLLRDRRYAELSVFVRELFYRGWLRLAGDRLSRLLRPFASSGRFTRITSQSRIFEEELGMRLMLNSVVEWLTGLDVNLVPLRAPASFVRTRENACEDDMWCRRCLDLEIIEIPGQHHTVFEPENLGALRQAILGTKQHWNARR
jgi:thioesterase domain-containing protein